jgi:transposase
MVVNIYKAKKLANPDIKYDQLVKELAAECGIGKTTIQKIISEYNSKKTISSPKMTKTRKSISEKIDDFDKNAIRQKVHSFWRNHELPTLEKIVQSVNEDESLPTLKRTTMYHLLKELNFVYTKRQRNSILMEREDLILWRRRYLKSIKQFREEGRTIYYLDETWCNGGDCSTKVWLDSSIRSSRDAYQKELTVGATNPTGKGKRLIVVHIGSRDGFVNGGLLCFESKTNSADYHNEMNGENFLEWFKTILPKLNDNAVIVMDNAPYHSVKMDKIPVISWKKADIMKWLQEKNIDFDDALVKAELLALVRQHAPPYDKYVVDETAKAANMTVLRLPPYHCELNPIELAWAQVKGYVKANNTTFKLNDVKQLLIDGVARVTPENWRNYEKHILEGESKFWDLDRIVDDLFDAADYTCTFTVGTGDTSSDDF